MLSIGLIWLRIGTNDWVTRRGFDKLTEHRLLLLTLPVANQHHVTPCVQRNNLH